LPTTAIAAEPMLRLGFFLGILLAMALWEALAPRQRQAIGRVRRWPGNLGIIVLDTLIVRFLFPLAGVGTAFLAQSQGWGLFNILPCPPGLPYPRPCFCWISPSTGSMSRFMRCRCYGACTACIMPIWNST
jgi:hypothetical protein